jgi:DNA-binding CsgD family transcriptional regulator
MTETPQTVLSERELEILRLVATGASNKEIAYQLSISANTVKVHLRNIFGKIGVASRTEAAMYAVKMGVVTTQDASASANDLVDDMPVSDIIGEPKGQSGENGLSQSRFIWPFTFLAGVIFLLIFVGGFLWRNRNQQETLQPTDTSAVLPVETDLERWQVRTNMPTKRIANAMVAYENRIYTIAGKTEAGVTGVMEQYDPVADLWRTDFPAKPVPVTDVGAVVLGGKIYVPGGVTASGDVTNTVDVYDLQQAIWKHAAPMPINLSAYAIVTFEGHFYVFGGWDGKAFVNKVWMYLSEQDAWVERAAMPTVRGYAGAITVANKIYVLGGYDGKKALTDNWTYLPERNDVDPWEQNTALPQGYYDMGIASIADTIYILGGKGSNPKPLAFPVPLNSWQEIALPPDGYEIHGSTRMAQVGEYLYVFSVNDQVGFIAQHLAYRAIYTVQIPVIINK